ncbi:unnamed protein product [Oreochromis niloticus]|nr:unnamed protein product [Mustela putorius furo]
METTGFWLLLAAHFILICQQAEGYGYRNQRKFSEDIDWSYAGTLNQNNWAKKFPSCSNAKQSPINIEQNLAQVKLQYQKLSFDGWENLTTNRTTIKNDGKTVTVNVDGDFYVSGGGLRSKVKVGCITFHWGCCNASSEGSEHSLDGVKYPLEMQIYCYDPLRFDSLDQSIKAGGRITALAVLFEISTEDNMNYAAIIEGINSVSRYGTAGKSARVSPFTLQGLLPNSTEKYFIYNGSLTTPPCSEVVEWIVFKNTVAISDDQLVMFCEVMTMQQAGYVMLMDYLQNNYREQQEQFMGLVFSSYTGTEEIFTRVCSSEPENIQVVPHNLSSLLVTWERPRAVYDSSIEKYSVNYRLASTENAVSSEYLTDGDQDVGAILDDLLANTSYMVQVVAVCSNGLYGRSSNPLMVVMPIDNPENALDPASYEYSNEVKYDPDLTWDEIGQTKDYDLDWSATNLQRTTTSESPFLLLPTIRTTTVESGHSKVTKDPVPPVRSTQSGQVLSNSEEMQQHSTSMWSPEMTLPPETRGRANFNANALFNLTKTTKENSLYTATAPSHRTIKIDGVHGGVTLNGKGKVEGGISTSAPTVTTSKADYINRGLSQQDYSGKVTNTTPTITSAKTKDGNISQSGNTATNVMSHISNVSSTTSSSTSFIQTKTDPSLARPTNKDNTTDRSVSTKPRGIPEIQTESSASKPSSSPTKTSVQLSRILLQTTKPLSNATSSAIMESWFSVSSVLTPSPTASPTTLAPEGQVIDASTSASGSGLFPDSQEGVDQEWDMVQTSTSGESMLPHSMNVISSASPSSTSEAGQTPDDLDEHPSAFYFESESSNALGFEVGDTTTEAVTSASTWSLGREEGSSSGQSESLYDNETSSDFSISEHTERELTEEEPVADASNSSHESRVGSIREQERKAVVPLAVISTLAVLGLIALICVLVYWRLCFQSAHFYIHDSCSTRVITAPDTAISGEHRAFPVKDFVKHVAELHHTQSFKREFETLKPSYEEAQMCTVDMMMSTDNANHPDSKTENRHSNISAYDDTQAHLSLLANKKGKATDYINANYVDGFKKPQLYVAAQGPVRPSIEDFWRMIWEQNICIIVMISNLVEKGCRICDQYWPLEVQEEYGSFLVTVKSTKVLAYYTQRTFTIRKIQIKKSSQKGRAKEGANERTVTQYHYTQWPDTGVPDLALPFLSFIHKSSRARTDDMGPLMVHCSAGVGRTGTYIVLDSMLTQIQNEGSVNVMGFLKQIHTQRKCLVQTEEQYVFIHNALVEAILCGETEVAVAQLHKYVDKLMTPGPDGGTGMDQQFKMVCYTNLKHCDYSTALQDCNYNKNRNCSVIPIERSRVCLPKTAGETADYINASYIAGYRHTKEFIITQKPLPVTVKDFWTMIWDHNAQVIVSLPGMEEEAEPFVFWPYKGQLISYEMFTVTQKSETHVCLSNEDLLIVQDYILKDTKNDYVLEVRHYRAPNWPNPDSPLTSTFELLKLVNEEILTKDSPTVVHDNVGGFTAGLFCALSSLTRQLDAEASVDVFQVARLMNLMRPGTFSNIEQYQFLYKAMLSLIGTQEDEKTQSFDANGTIVTETTSTAESIESLVPTNK